MHAIAKIALAVFFMEFGAGLYAQTIEIHQIDVGAGDGALLIVRNSVRQINILIDAGPRSAGEYVINYLKSPAGGNLGAHPYFDYIISSHYHEDHIGGFVGAKKRDTSGCFKYHGVFGASSGISWFAVLDKGAVAPVPASGVYSDYNTLSQNRRVRIGALAVGQGGAVNTIAPPAPVVPPPLPGLNQRLALGGFIDLGTDANGVPIRLRLLLSDANLYAPGKPPAYIMNLADSSNVDRNGRGAKINPNNWGLAWVLEYGKFRYFTGGDIGGEDTANYIDIETPLTTQLQLTYPLPASALGHVCAFKSDHHGSEHSTNQAFMDGLKPTAGVISSGGRHNHPTQDVINRMEATNWGPLANMTFQQLRHYYITELQYIRNLDPARAITSGNVDLVSNEIPIPTPPAEDSFQMANLSYLYQMDKTVTGEIPGDVKLLVYPQNNNGISINALSSFVLQWKPYNAAAWIPGWRYDCHN
jgi:hypothetical protein